MPSPLRALALVAASLLAAAAPEAQVLAAATEPALSALDAAPRSALPPAAMAQDMLPDALASSPTLATEGGRLLLVTGAGVAGSALLLGGSRATGEIALALFAPGGAALLSYATAEALGTDGTLGNAFAGAGLGALVALGTALRYGEDDLSLALFATLPAVGSAVALRVGAPTLLRTSTGETVPGWSMRVWL